MGTWEKYLQADFQVVDLYDACNKKPFNNISDQIFAGFHVCCSLPYQSLLLQKVVGFFSFFAILVLQLLQSEEKTNRV